MPDNPKPHGAPAVALPDHRILDLSGPDAGAFAQAQFMNDVAALGDGDWQWNGWLTPKGRLVALFALLRIDAGNYRLLLPDHPADALAEALQRYVFRSKVKLAVRGDLHVSGQWDAASPSAVRRFQADAAHGIALAWPAGRRIDITLSLPADADAGALQRWHATDLRAGIPRLAADQSSQWTPQQLSLERLQAFSVKKGCYPGQEIVARTHFLGQAKRGLVLLEADTPPQSGDAISDGERVIGQVIAVAGHSALGVASEGTPREAGGIPVRQVEFSA